MRSTDDIERELQQTKEALSDAKSALFSERYNVLADANKDHERDLARQVSDLETRTKRLVDELWAARAAEAKERAHDDRHDPAEDADEDEDEDDLGSYTRAGAASRSPRAARTSVRTKGSSGPTTMRGFLAMSGLAVIGVVVVMWSYLHTVLLYGPQLALLGGALLAVAFFIPRAASLRAAGTAIAVIGLTHYALPLLVGDGTGGTWGRGFWWAALFIAASLAVACTAGFVARPASIALLRKR